MFKESTTSSRKRSLLKFVKEMAEALGLLPAAQPPHTTITNRTITNHRDYPVGYFVETQLGRGKTLRYVDCALTHSVHQTTYTDESTASEIHYSGRLFVNLNKLSRDGYPVGVVSAFSKEVLFLPPCRIVMDFRTGRYIYADVNDHNEHLGKTEVYLANILRLEKRLMPPT